MPKTPIRIAQMMTDMNYGGVEMVVMNYYRHIDRTRIQFDFFALEGSSIPQKEEIETLGGRIYIVPKYTHILQYEKAIQKIFKENNYKIVHSHMNTLGVFSLYGAKKAGIPIRILTNHSTSGKGETKKNIMKYALKPFAKIFPTHICACSNYAGQWLYGKNADFKVINNAIDLNKYKFNSEVRNNLRNELNLQKKFVIGHIGRFCYQKNHELLIDIFYNVLKKNNNAVLLLIGEGELENSIKAKVKDMNIEDNVIFLGKRNDAYKYYQAMDVFLLPSRYEGLPVVGVEAQASGLPCVFSNNVTPEAKLLDTTVFVNGGIEDYANEVIKAQNYKRKDTSYEMRKVGFDIDKEAKKLSKFYEGLLTK